MRCRLLVLLLASAVARPATAQTITTVAGNGGRVSSANGGMATESTLLFRTDGSPNVVPDLDGNICFPEDFSSRVRCVMKKTGRLATIAGRGEIGNPSRDGTTALEAFVHPRQIAFDGWGNLFVNDRGSLIRRVDRKSRVMATVAGSMTSNLIWEGSATATPLALAGFTFDRQDNLVLISNSTIFRVDLSTGVLARVAGGGPLPFTPGRPVADMDLDDAASPRYDRWGNLFLSFSCDNIILRVDARTGLTSTVAGIRRYNRSKCDDGGYSGDGGPATSAELRRPSGIELDAVGNIFICDRLNHAIRRVDAKTGVITTVAGGTRGASFSGDGGPANKAGLSSPSGLGLDGLGNLLIIDAGNGRIRRVEDVAAR